MSAPPLVLRHAQLMALSAPHHALLAGQLRQRFDSTAPGRRAGSELAAEIAAALAQGRSLGLESDAALERFVGLRLLFGPALLDHPPLARLFAQPGLTPDEALGLSAVIPAVSWERLSTPPAQGAAPLVTPPLAPPIRILRRRCRRCASTVLRAHPHGYDCACGERNPCRACVADDSGRCPVCRLTPCAACGAPGVSGGRCSPPRDLRLLAGLPAALYRPGPAPHCLAEALLDRLEQVQGFATPLLLPSNEEDDAPRVRSQALEVLHRVLEQSTTDADPGTRCSLLLALALRVAAARCMTEPERAAGYPALGPIGSVHPASPGARMVAVHRHQLVAVFGGEEGLVDVAAALTADPLAAHLESGLSREEAASWIHELADAADLVPAAVFDHLLLCRQAERTSPTQGVELDLLARLRRMLPGAACAEEARA